VPRNGDFNGTTSLEQGYVQTTCAKRSSFRYCFQTTCALCRISKIEKTRLGRAPRDVDGKLVQVFNSPWQHASYHTHARRNGTPVIGGTFSSPHLLMASGIGPALHLPDMGVREPTMNFTGVGEMLQDPAFWRGLGI
jgi:choline dehydrogenase-like flavoprotein